MSLLLHGESFLLIPIVFSFAAVALLFVALKKIDFIKRNRVVAGLVMIVILFLIFGGVFLLSLFGLGLGVEV